MVALEVRSCAQQGTRPLLTELLELGVAHQRELVQLVSFALVERLVIGGYGERPADLPEP